MSVSLKCSDSAKSCSLFMIELQGTIVGKESNSFDGKQLGKLRKNEKGNYELVIGNHVLEGVLSSLKTPLVVLEPSERTDSFKGNDELRSSICNVRGIVREKILFKTRPKIVVGALGDDMEATTRYIARS